jgi:hypothetical protein
MTDQPDEKRTFKAGGYIRDVLRADAVSNVVIQPWDVIQWKSEDFENVKWTTNFDNAARLVFASAQTELSKEHLFKVPHHLAAIYIPDKALIHVKGPIEAEDAAEAQVTPGRDLPPAVAEFLLALLGPRDRVDTMLGDLQEIFERDCVALGRRRASLRYWGQALRSILPLLIARLRNWGAFVALIELGRRKIGW